MVNHWSIKDNAVLVPPAGPIISEAQARQIAYNAFTQMTDRPGTYNAGGISWQPLSNSTTLTRLTYGFSWHVAENIVYSPDVDTEYAGNPEMYIGITVDAETGEVLSGGNMAGSAAGNALRSLKPSPRLRLLYEALKARISDPLTVALASGKPATATHPSSSALRFTHQINDKQVTFALNASARRLTWETKPGKWADIALPQHRAQELADWIDRKQAKESATK